MTMSATENHVANHALTIPGRNGGRLRNGGTNKGGPGRTPDKIKRIAQQELRKRIRLLGHFADGVAVSVVEETGTDGEPVQTHKLHSTAVNDRIRALEALHKIGMGETVSTADVRDRLKTQVRLIRASALDEASKELVLSLLGEVWR